MRSAHLVHLRCPACRGRLELARADGAAEVEDGELGCIGCAATYSVVRGVPRFVSSDNYAWGFGLQWKVHRRTQLDSGRRLLSRRRFFEQTGWPEDLTGETIVEAGSGAGRFTAVVADTGAMVLSLDYSDAVDANYETNGDRENVLIVQADIYNIPFASADRAFCFGVLQHTPDPDAAFEALKDAVRPGGAIAADVYVKSIGRYVFGTKYWVRPLTRRLPSERLYRATCRYVDLMWPLVRLLRRLPKIGSPIAWRLLVPDYRDLPESVAKEWARLDAFDMLAPRYDRPRSRRAVARWGRELRGFEILRCPQGLMIRGRREPEVDIVPRESAFSA